MPPETQPARRPIQDLWDRLNPVLDRLEQLPRRNPDGSLAAPPLAEVAS